MFFGLFFSGSLEPLLAYGTDMPTFKETLDEAQRKNESLKMLQRYPDRLPIIVEKASTASPHIKDLEKKKYLVPPKLKVGTFIGFVRQRRKCQHGGDVLDQDETIFLYVDNTLVAPKTTMEELYRDHKDDDGFLYMVFSTENTFGCW